LGETPSDAWTSREVLESTGKLYTDRFKQWDDALEAFPTKNIEYLEKRKAWVVTRDYPKSIKAEKIPQASRG
jgi:hypothetical protein